MVIFDLDGTLIDTLPDIAAAFNLVLAGEGFPVHPVLSYKNFVGWGLRRSLELALTGDTSKAQFETMLETVIDEYGRRPAILSKPYSGIPELLAELSSEDIPMAVLTNKAQPIARKIIAGLLPSIDFVQILGAQDPRPLKPNPAGIKELEECLQYSQSPILMVGDTPVDCKTAENANVEFCGVLWGYRSEEELRASGSTTNVRTPDELRRWIIGKEEKET